MRFEVLRRDGTARLGEFEIGGETIRTPCLIGRDELERMKIEPHSFIPRLNEDIIEELNPPQGDEEYDARVIYYPILPTKNAFLYILASANQYLGDYRTLSKALMKIGDNIPPDSALFLPAIASPENVSIFLFYGVDLFDDIYGKISALRGVYLTTEGGFRLEDLREFPCNCPECLGRSPEEMKRFSKRERIDFLKSHNRYALEAEIKKVRILIAKENIREYVEKQCRSSPWLTALLRIVRDDFAEKRSPLFRKTYLYANTFESLGRIEVKNFNRRVMERYEKPDLDTLLILPCSARKPYSLSLSHKKILDVLSKYRRYIHEVILTSPLGIVPRELEIVYPASHYDIPVTGRWVEEEKDWAKNCLKRYLKKNLYESVIAHVDGVYKEICKEVEGDIGLEFIYTCEDGVTGKRSLENLGEVISGVKKDKAMTSKERKLFSIRSMASYQFGGKIAEDLLSGDVKVRGRYPKMTAFDGKNQILKVNRPYGSLDLTIDGALKIKRNSDDYSVEIDDFVPTGDVFAVGVLDADEGIRPNDIVIFEGKRSFGIGRAKMAGWEMIRAKRGSAIRVESVKVK
ncbi:MAG: Archaeosine synthase [Candidatus Methanolliviera sp. GoM_asphalt]|nr:MAG: Archaeosine synthase [Candidatus Methanolliviera sp. GoM_asphalt]